MNHVQKTINDAAAAGFLCQQSQREERNHEAANEQANAVNRIGYGNRLQTAENGVAGTDNANDDTQHADGRKPCDAQRSRKIKNSLECNRTGIQNDRQVQNGVHNNRQHGENQSRGAVEACLHQLRHRGDAVLQIGRQEEICQDKQGEQRAYLKCHRAHIGSPALTVGADQLFS